jgi:hypothetical protein
VDGGFNLMPKIIGKKPPQEDDFFPYADGPHKLLGG